MKYIEIDGERIEVHGCDDCPCCDQGDGGYGATCKHPRNSEVEEYGSRYTFYARCGIFLEDVECPLREVDE
jgi:hypothetical protein